MMDSGLIESSTGNLNFSLFLQMLIQTVNALSTLSNQNLETC